MKIITRRRILGLIALVLLFLCGPAPPAEPGEPPQGRYFAKKEYVPKPLPDFAETKARLPSPIYDEHPLYVEMYWRTWELAFGNFYEPPG